MESGGRYVVLILEWFETNEKKDLCKRSDGTIMVHVDGSRPVTDNPSSFHVDKVRTGGCQGHSRRCMVEVRKG